MKKSLITLLVFLTIFSVLAVPVLVSANDDPPPPDDNVLDLGLPEVGDNIGLGTQDVRVTIARVIRVAMGLLGVVAVIIILIGGFKYMTAMGNDEEVKKAKKLITSGIIGLVIILLSFAIASFVLNSIQTAATSV